jgi:uncharacterized damage-inducible protein DinB
MTLTARRDVNCRPATSEYSPGLHAEVVLVPDGDVVAIMRDQVEETARIIREVPESRLGYRYAEGKWSMKEVLGHVIDAERIFIYRALAIARGDTLNLPGFEQADYVRGASFDEVPVDDLISELKTVRAASVAFFRNLDPGSWQKMGKANGSPVSVRALAYVVAGHELHHRKLLLERYLGS